MLILPKKATNNQNYKIFFERNSTFLDYLEIIPSFNAKTPKDLRESALSPNSFYLACGSSNEISFNKSNKCKEIITKLPKKGGIVNFSNQKIVSIPSSNPFLLAIGFISNIKLSKTKIPGFDSFLSTKNSQNLSIFYKKNTLPFEEDFIEEIHLKCGEIDYKLLEKGFFMNNNIESGFQLYYQKKSYPNSLPKSFFSHMYLEIVPEDEENKSFDDILLKNPLWNKLQCFNANEHLNIKLYYKQEIISDVWENIINPHVFLKCQSSLNEILTLYPNFSSQIEIIGFCPQNCLKTLNEIENYVYGNYVYSGNSSVCGAAIHYGLINDFYSGFVKFSWYSNVISKENFFMFESLIGKTETNPISSLKIKKIEVSSYFKSFLEISDRNKAELTNIPNEVLSKISETMNQNSKEIIKQNYNIEELWKENSGLNHKIEELEKGENGIGNLSKTILNLEENLMNIQENLNLIIVNQQNSHQIFQKEIENVRFRSQNAVNFLKNSSLIIEDFSNVCKREFIIIFF